MVTEGEAALVGLAGVAERAVGGLYDGAALAATTPRPLNSAGVAVAAIEGLPRFTDSYSPRLVLAD